MKIRFSQFFKEGGFQFTINFKTLDVLIGVSITYWALPLCIVFGFLDEDGDANFGCNILCCFIRIIHNKG